MKSIFKIDQTTKGFLCLLSVFAAGLSSCDDDNLSDGNVTDGSIEFRFDLPQTRAVIAEQTGEGFFEDNDKVGLYTYESGNHRYHQLTLQGGHWLPSLKPAELGKNEVMLSVFLSGSANARRTGDARYRLHGAYRSKYRGRLTAIRFARCAA